MIENKDINNSNKQLHIQIETLAAGTLTLTQADIQNSNSVSINNKAVSGSEFEFGAVYAAECTFSFLSDVDRYMLYNATVTVQCSNGTDTVDKGVYYISEAVRNGSYITITAYDGMPFLDVNVKDNTYGNVWTLLNYAAENCDVAIAQTEEEINALPNAGYSYALLSDEVETYRDLVSYLAKVTCTFAIFDAQGKLRLCPFHTAPTVDLVLDKSQRIKPEVSDYEIYFTSVRARFVVSDAYQEYIEKQDEDTTYCHDFGDIPIVHVPEEQQQEIMKTLLAQAVKIRYVPVSVKIRFNPFIELGDRVELPDTNNKGDKVYSYVMEYTWSFRGQTRISSVGSNPRLANPKTKQDKQLSSLENSLSAKNMIVRSFTNAKEITLGSTEKVLISMNYSAVQDAHPIFLATIPFTIDRDGYVVFRYYLDGAVMEEDTIRQYVERGEHFATLTNNFLIEKDKRATVSLRACTEYFESDRRKQDAQILSILDYVKNQSIKTDTSGNAALTVKYQDTDIDTTIPNATIAKAAIKAVLFGQGMAGQGKWDGTLNVAEDFTAIRIDGGKITIGTFTETFTAAVQEPKRITAADTYETIQAFPGGEKLVAHFTEDIITMGKEVLHRESDEILHPIRIEHRTIMLSPMTDAVEVGTETE